VEIGNYLLGFGEKVRVGLKSDYLSSIQVKGGKKT